MMKRSFIAAALGSAGLVGVVGLAYAGSPAEKFATMDADADGYVTEAEFMTVALADGKSEEDAKAWFTGHAGTDGLLTLAEMEAGAEKKDDYEERTGS